MTNEPTRDDKTIPTIIDYGGFFRTMTDDAKYRADRARRNAAQELAQARKPSPYFPPTGESRAILKEVRNIIVPLNIALQCVDGTERFEQLRAIVSEMASKLAESDDAITYATQDLEAND